MSQTPYQQQYQAGKMLQITVPSTVSVADKEYKFLQWDNLSRELTRNVSMDSDIELTATYGASTQAGFSLWTIPVAIGVVIIMFAFKDHDKKKRKN